MKCKKCRMCHHLNMKCAILSMLKNFHLCQIDFPEKYKYLRWEQQFKQTYAFLVHLF